MNTEISRRSACDRCRGQKLRCVRITKPGDSGWDGSIQTGEDQLGACERCLKAGADCINTLSPQRKYIRPERLQAPLLNFTSEIPKSHSGFLYTNQHGVTHIPGSSNGRMAERISRLPESPSVHQPRTNFQDHFKERPAKRISLEQPPDHLEINGDQFGLSAIQHIGSSNGGSASSSNSISTESLDHQNLNTGGSSTSKPSGTTSVESFDFGIRLTPEISSTHQTSTADMMDIISIPKETSLSNITTENHTKQAPELNNPTPVSREDCLNRLSQLSSRLLQEFSKNNSTKLSDVLSFSVVSNPQGSTGLKNTIGRVLECSQTFLDIIQYLKEPSFNNNSDLSSSTGSECSYSEYWDDNDFIPIRNNGHVYSTSVNDIVPSSEDQARDQRKPSHGTVDMPTTLTILTCYTWLLQSYDTIFLRIHTSLLSQSKISPQSIPAILPGLHIGGFDLGDRNDLQMEILIQVSSKMLERIEETLGITVVSQNRLACKGILDSDSAGALLDIMFKQKEMGEQGRVVLVKQTMDSIRELLRGNGL